MEEAAEGSGSDSVTPWRSPVPMRGSSPPRAHWPSPGSVASKTGFCTWPKVQKERQEHYQQGDSKEQVTPWHCIPIVWLPELFALVVLDQVGIAAHRGGKREKGSAAVLDWASNRRAEKARTDQKYGNTFVWQKILPHLLPQVAQNLWEGM